MAEIVNLNRARKRVAQSKEESEAQTNRAKFGRTRAERDRDERNASHAETKLDQHRLNEDEQ